MTFSHSDFSIEMFTLPHEDPLDHARLFSEWTAAYPYSTPIERGLIHQAAVALMEKRRIERDPRHVADSEGPDGRPRLGAGPGGYGRVLGGQVQRSLPVGPGRPASQCGRLSMGHRLLVQARPAASRRRHMVWRISGRRDTAPGPIGLPQRAFRLGDRLFDLAGLPRLPAQPEAEGYRPHSGLEAYSEGDPGPRYRALAPGPGGLLVHGCRRSWTASCRG